MAEQRPQTGASSAVLSEGWELEQSSHILGRKYMFCSTSVFLSYMIGMIEVEVRHYPKIVVGTLA